MMVQGVEELKQNFAKLAKEYGREIAQAAVAGGEVVRSTAVKSIQRKSRGAEVKRYRLGGGSYSHTVSKPGDPPNTDTGALVKSVHVEVKSDDVYVGSGLKYAPWLEFGTKDMKERPWLFPALEANKQKIKNLIANAVKKVTR